MTKIELTPEEVELFKLFRKHQDEFIVLVNHNVFEIKNGSAELHFDSNGNLASINAHVKVWRNPQKLY